MVLSTYRRWMFFQVNKRTFRVTWNNPALGEGAATVAGCFYNIESLFFSNLNKYVSKDICHRVYVYDDKSQLWFFHGIFLGSNLDLNMPVEMNLVVFTNVENERDLGWATRGMENPREALERYPYILYYPWVIQEQKRRVWIERREGGMTKEDSWRIFWHRARRHTEVSYRILSTSFVDSLPPFDITSELSQLSSLLAVHPSSLCTLTLKFISSIRADTSLWAMLSFHLLLILPLSLLYRLPRVRARSHWLSSLRKSTKKMMENEKV